MQDEVEFPCPRPLPVSASALIAGQAAVLGNAQLLRNILDCHGGYLYDPREFLVTDPESLPEALANFVKAQALLALDVEITKSGTIWFSIGEVSISHP